MTTHPLLRRRRRAGAALARRTLRRRRNLLLQRSVDAPRLRSPRRRAAAPPLPSVAVEGRRALARSPPPRLRQRQPAEVPDAAVADPASLTRRRRRPKA